MTINQNPTDDMSMGRRMQLRWPEHADVELDGEMLICPRCKQWESGLHPSLAKMVIWPDDDCYDSPAGTRGEFILIPMSCEQCDLLEEGGKRDGVALVIGNHKGGLTLRLVLARE